MKKMVEYIKNMLDLRDIHVYGGILLISIGLWFVYWQLSLVITGVLLIFIALRRA